MEYGWNRIQVHNADGEDDASVYHRDHADTMSIRSGRSVRLGRHNSNLNRGGPIPAERMFVHEWKPPMPPSLASTSDEETQLEALQKQVGNLKLELERHNDLRKPMQELVRRAVLWHGHH
jgi:PH/SEC7 domain-containing protein